MRTKKITGLILGLLIMAGVESTAQDLVYSQFFSAPLQLNPAFAGASFSSRIAANYRNQWPGWPNAYRSYSLSYDQWVDGFNSGIGLNLLTDDAGNGLYRTTRATATYSYQVQMADRLYFRLGMDAGIIQQRLNWSSLVFGDQLNPITGAVDGAGNQNQGSETPPNQLTALAPDISAGLLIFSSTFHAGISLMHLNTPDINHLRINNNLQGGLPMRLTMHAGLEIPFNQGNIGRTDAFISPNVLVSTQGGYTQINGGLYTGIDKILGGLWYRHTPGNSDALIVMGGFRQGIMRISYSLDLTVSALASAGTGGGHELSVALNFADSRASRKKSDLNDCFKIFR